MPNMAEIASKHIEIQQIISVTFSALAGRIIATNITTTARIAVTINVAKQVRFCAFAFDVVNAIILSVFFCLVLIIHFLSKINNSFVGSA